MSPRSSERHRNRGLRSDRADTARPEELSGDDGKRALVPAPLSFRIQNSSGSSILPMPTLDSTSPCPVHDSFRVRQVAGMFDLPCRNALDEHFTVEVPDVDDPGRSASSSAPPAAAKPPSPAPPSATHLYAAGDWPADRAVIDCFGDLPIQRDHADAHRRRLQQPAGVDQAVRGAEQRREVPVRSGEGAARAGLSG